MMAMMTIRDVKEVAEHNAIDAEFCAQTRQQSIEREPYCGEEIITPIIHLIGHTILHIYRCAYARPNSKRSVFKAT